MAVAKKKKVVKGKAYISTSFNNTIITITDDKGNTLAWSSPSVLGYKGTKRNNTYVATKAAEDVAMKSKKFGLIEVDVFIKGPGAGRSAAVKGLAQGGLRILSLRDITPIKHGGTRSRKPPRN